MADNGGNPPDVTEPFRKKVKLLPQGRQGVDRETQIKVRSLRSVWFIGLALAAI